MHIDWGPSLVALDAMPSSLQGTYCVVPLHLGHEEIVGVEGGEGKDADAPVPQRVDQGCEDAHRSQVERANDFETAPPCGALNGMGNPLLRAYDRQFILSASDAHQWRSMPRPFRNSGARMQPYDCQPTG